MQKSADETSYRFPLCIYDRLSAADVSVEARWKAIDGRVDQAGGVVARYSPDNYYVARANALEDNVNLFRVINGKREKVDEVPVKVAPHTWHTLRLEAQGPRLRVYFNGELVIDREDTSISRAGKTGLWTKADSVSAFTDFRVRVLP